MGILARAGVLRCFLNLLRRFRFLSFPGFRLRLRLQMQAHTARVGEKGVSHGPRFPRNSTQPLSLNTLIQEL